MLSRELLILSPPLYSMNPSSRNLFMKKVTRDRVVPTIGVPRLEGMFEAAGWQVLTVKYGHLLEGLFTRPGGAALRTRLASRRSGPA